MDKNIITEKSLYRKTVTFPDAKVVGVAIGMKRGMSKRQVPFIDLIEQDGILNDAHAGTEKQVSLVAREDIDWMNKKFGLDAETGSFAENITTQGIDLMSLAPGKNIQIDGSVLQVVCLGKEKEEMKTHTFSYKGHTLLPQKGLFCKVIKGGRVKAGDKIILLGV
jgi:MOSC domain-containing protein YiiM